ncbi:ABC transporter permease [Halogeometricum luteum]|uniref:ABC transporter permease n=1 Tax=Halogeometricum luteum TaxID=2950537 RepID=A0ABU2G4L4_9EURY|nr:ABC transporter permease [Halogeometricum sp. S3BR5-2]MDS0295732.1 ABC transporter permease [Halogeometricum sp. S3BR5-2]
MVSRIIRRLAQAILTVYVVVTLTFGMIRLMPGGPMDYLRGQLIQSTGGQVSTQQINQLVEAYTNVNPDQPLWSQYIDYVIEIASGDFGRSVVYNDPVSQILAQALPWTLLLMVTSLFLMFVVGVGLGAVMAYHEGERVDLGGTLAGILLNSIPYYVAGILLVYVLGYQLEWFPTGGRMTQSTVVGFNYPFIAGVFHHAALPIVSLVITGFGGWALSMRGNSIRILGEDYLRVAELRGLPSRRISLWYVGRNAILPMYTGLLINIGFIFGGSVILEQIFRYPGVGYYLYTSIGARDYPLMMGGFLVITITVAIGVFIADVTYGYIDPRAGGEGNESY